MSSLNGNALQIGNSGTASQNATLTANGDGTFTLARGNIGATIQDLLTIDANGVVTLTQQDQVKSGSVIATTSGTSHDFTGIPDWVKKITVMLSGVSSSGSSSMMLQIGDSGGIENTNYNGSASRLSTGVLSEKNSTGFVISASNTAGSIYHGSVTLSLLDSSDNTWSISGALGRSDTASGTTQNIAGSKVLSGVLDRIRLTTKNGTDTFDAGKINILYEG